MELWIRSQDKEILVKVNNLSLVFNNKNETCEIINSFEDHQCWELGTYKTKERALEVLDEIHQRLIDLQTLEITPYFYKVCKRNLDNVYEMPKE